MEIITILLLYLLIFLTGDESMFILAFLSAQGYFSIFLIFLISVLANLSSDLCYYFFGNKILNRLKFKSILKYKETTKRLFKRFKKPELVLFLSKFVYGTRILTITTFGLDKPISFKRFLLINTLALSLIGSVILSLGWFFGGILNFPLLFKSFKILSLTLIILVVLFYLIKKLINKWVNKKFVQSSLPTRKKRE